MEMMLERLCKVVMLNEMQLGFMPEKDIINAVFTLRRLQQVHCAKRTT